MALSRAVRRAIAKLNKATEGVQVTVQHEAWMERDVNAGVQLSPDDKDIIYEQR